MDINQVHRMFHKNLVDNKCFKLTSFSARLNNVLKNYTPSKSLQSKILPFAYDDNFV